MLRTSAERKIPFNCYLTLAQLEELEVVSAQKGRPKAELIREAVAEYLEKLSGQKSQQSNPLK